MKLSNGMLHQNLKIIYMRTLNTHRVEVNLKSENFFFSKSFEKKYYLQIYNKKPRWHSESKLAELIKESPRFFQRQALVPANSLPAIPDSDQPYFYEQNFPNNTSEDSRPFNTPVRISLILIFELFSFF